MLDTNICIYALKRRPPEVLSRLERLTPADVAVSAVTAAELRFGASKSSAPERNHRVLDVFLGHINVLAFDVDAATSYGRVRAHLERRGRPIGAMDTLIAAHALSLGATLVSNNVREFKRVPRLRCENWVS